MVCRLTVHADADVVLAGRVLFRASFNKVRPANVVEQMDQPILFIHGEEDTVISPEETVELRSISNLSWLVSDGSSGPSV